MIVTPRAPLYGLLDPVLPLEISLREHIDQRDLDSALRIPVVEKRFPNAEIAGDVPESFHVSDREGHAWRVDR